MTEEITEIMHRLSELVNQSDDQFIRGHLGMACAHLALALLSSQELDKVDSDALT
jgi:hypothetical protein